jgi:catechol 2,3-dioxygenase-like lactoylglutathione lyase family enzyme
MNRLRTVPATRGRVWRRAVVLAALVVATCFPLLAADAPAVRAVADVGMTVGDLDRSVAFFTSILDFETVDEHTAAGAAFASLEGVAGARARVARLRLGGETLELTQYLSPLGRAVPADSRSHDRWFQHVAIIVSDMYRAYARLRAHHVTHASNAPQTLPEWNRAAAGIKAFYFKDPDGHALEILEFPPGKGDPRWQRAGDASPDPDGKGPLFLGIDHTAIVVADTDRSLRLYRDALGLRIAGESDNYGSEQEHLNAVFGAHLRITSLRAAAGPGIELLEYLAPGDGRPAPNDERSNDLIHWQTRLVTADPEGTAASAQRAGARPVTARLFRDPDGHAILFTAQGESR